MQSHFDSQGRSEDRIALLEARLAEIQASREELRRELVRRACEPARRRTRIPAGLALFFSLVALGMAAWGIGALLAPGPSDDVVVQLLVEEDTVAAGSGSPPVAVKPTPLVVQPSPPETMDKPDKGTSGRKVGKRGGRKRPPRKEEKPSIIDTFSECGLDRSAVESTENKDLPRVGASVWKMLGWIWLLLEGSRPRLKASTPV